MRRAPVGVVVAGAVAAGVSAGQVRLARWTRVLVPDQIYEAGNDTWPFQLVLIVWCSASAAVLGAAAGGSLNRTGWWRYLVPVTAGLGALAPRGTVSGWAAAATSATADPAGAAGTATVLGAAVGVVFGAAVLAWRGLGRSAVVWIGWVWLNVAAEVAGRGVGWPARDAVVSVEPLGLFTPRWPGPNDAVILLALVAALIPAALLGWWGSRRGDHAVLLGAVIGPVLLVATHVVVPPLPGGDSDGDHYSLAGNLSAWLLVAVVGLAVAALAAFAAGRSGFRARDAAPGTGGPGIAASGRDVDQAPVGVPARRNGAGGVAASLLTVTASMLGTAALLMMWRAGAGWLDAGAAGIVLGSAVAERRGRELPRIAGAGWALAGIAGLVLASFLFRDSEDVLQVVARGIVPPLVVMVLIGALARGVTGAAWCAVGVGGLHAVVPVLGPAGFGALPPHGHDLLVAVFGLLAVVAALFVLRATRGDRHAVPH